MSLARPGLGGLGLTINTGVANAPSTQSAQPAPTGGTGLLGSTNSQQQQQQPGSTSATATAAPGPATMSLFGNAAQKPATGLFGASTTANTAQTGSTGGGLFGNAQQQNTTQQTGTTGGGLFGNAAGANQGQQQQQSTGGGLFGNANQQKTTTGLFGASTQQPQQQTQQTGGGLFGASTANTQQNTQQNTQASTGGGLFGQSQAKPLGFGATQNQQSQPQQSTNQVPAVQINYDNIRPRTRFDDLAKPVQDEIALIDKGIARVIKMKDQIGEFMPQHELDIAQLGRDVKFVESKFRTVQVALNSDIQTVKHLQDLTKRNIGDAQLSFKATDNLKLPAHYHQTGLFASTSGANGAGGGSSGAGGTSGGSGSSTNGTASGTHADAQDLISYFNRICDDVEKYKRRLDEYRAEIERDMPGVENGLYEQIRTLRDRHAAAAASANGDGSSAMSDQLGQVLLALREMGTAIVNQAGQIADTRERLSRLQAGILDSGVYGLA